MVIKLNIAHLVDVEVLTSKDLAARWLLNEGTLRQWRYTGKGPHFERIGCHCFYVLKVVEAYESTHPALAAAAAHTLAKK